MFQLLPIFISTLLISVSYGTLVYVNASFLESFLTQPIVTLLFVIGATLNIYLFLRTPHLMRKFGKEKMLFACILMTALSIFTLATASNPLALAFAFITYQGFIILIYLCLDVFLEEKSSDEYTGELRGIYYTFLNFGFALGPLIVAFLSSFDGFRLVYLVGGLILLIPLTLSTRNLFKERSVLEYTPDNHHLPWKTLWRKRNIRAVTLARFILEIFYGVMVVYIPPYLFNVAGFSWSEIGIILSVALLPFVFLEWPAGELADRFYGEKEIMSIGFFITGTTLLFMPFLDGSFLSWLIALFVSRIGAALIEIMTEVYFFKGITAAETGFLSIFRLGRPVGFLVGALLGGVIINAISYPAIFFALGVLVLFGLYESLHLKDTL